MIDLGNGVWLVTRAEWGARPPRSITRLQVGRNTDHWEGPHMGTFPHASCASKVRGIQNFHMDARGWGDIAYNTVSCPHGYVFEGRGRGVRSAANGTNAGNGGSYADCYLGGEGDPFTEAGARAKRAAGDWLTYPGSPRLGHRDWKATACPGDTIYHWTHAGQPVSGGPTPPPPPPPVQIPTEADLMPYPTIAVNDGAAATEGLHRPWAVLKPGQVVWLSNVPLDPLPRYDSPEAANAREVWMPGQPYWDGLYAGLYQAPKKFTHTLDGELTPVASTQMFDRVIASVRGSFATTFPAADLPPE